MQSMHPHNPNEIKYIDIEELGKKLDIAIDRTFDEPTMEDAIKCKPIIDNIILSKSNLNNMKKKYGVIYKNNYIYKCFKLLLSNDPDTYIHSHSIIRDRLKVKRLKSHSGVVSITVFTSGHPEYIKNGKTYQGKFSCKWDCAYCPNEPGQPRSYLKGEPGVMRANRNEFDCVRQMHDRMVTLYNNSHEVDKLEVLVLGGTWTSYPVEYREEFIRDIYYAANIFENGNTQHRTRRSIDYEQNCNRLAKCKVIGLTLETRPDTITPEELHRFRHYGCTRIQLGIQHIENDILKKINRGCNNDDAIKGIKLLKDCGYKIDAHWMPNLPGSSLKQDDNMLNNVLLGVEEKHYDKKNNNEKWVLTCPELQVDQWKIYPCTVVPYTKIEEWYREGTYVPYSVKTLTNLLLKTKSLVFPWIRLNRIVRDIPSSYSLNPDYESNLRNDLTDILKKDGLTCRCIRCREIKEREFNDNYTIIEREYNASDGTEIFIEAQYDDIIYGFLRLRYSTDNYSVFPELKGCTMIRELHVYGNIVSVCDNSENLLSSKTQHRGVGKALLQRAEHITKERFGYDKVSVISGEGTRQYYLKMGYRSSMEHGRYMMKHLV
jgi:ELP3 family radical SAM enzyme/protein acetyltransferase